MTQNFENISIYVSAGHLFLFWVAWFMTIILVGVLAPNWAPRLPFPFQTGEWLPSSHPSPTLAGCLLKVGSCKDYNVNDTFSTSPSTFSTFCIIHQVSIRIYLKLSWFRNLDANLNKQVAVFLEKQLHPSVKSFTQQDCRKHNFTPINQKR